MVGVHATVGQLSNNVFLDVSNIFKIVTERSRDRGQRSRDRRSTFFYSLFALATVVLPDGTNFVSVVLLSFQRYIKSSTSGISNAGLYERCKLNTRPNKFVRLTRKIIIIITDLNLRLRIS